MNIQLQNNNRASNPFLLHGKSKYSVQPKLTLNTPGDIYEQEADAMADKVMRMSSNEETGPVTGLIGKSLQRKCAHCEEEEKRKKPIMRKADAGHSGISVSSSFAATLNASKGGGQPLDAGTRGFMESRFGLDFGNVKIYNDSMAHQSAAEINSLAYTHGNHLVFGENQFQPNTDGGKRLLAHELTHVVQQQGSNQTSNITLQMQQQKSRKPGKVVRIEHHPRKPKNPWRFTDKSQYEAWKINHPNASYELVLPDHKGNRSTDVQYSPQRLTDRGFYFAWREEYGSGSCDIWLNDLGDGQRIRICFNKY